MWVDIFSEEDEEFTKYGTNDVNYFDIGLFGSLGVSLLSNCTILNYKILLDVSAQGVRHKLLSCWLQSFTLTS